MLMSTAKCLPKCKITYLSYEIPYGLIVVVARSTLLERTRRRRSKHSYFIRNWFVNIIQPYISSFVFLFKIFMKLYFLFIYIFFII